MLQFFRRIFHSKLGVIVTMGFLVLIALAFASADVSGGGTFGGVAGGDRAAEVGGERISTSELNQAATNSLENMKQDNPRLSMKGFLAQGGLDRVLDEIIDRTGMAVFGDRHGIVASDRLVDSEIAKMQAFHGPDGKFSEPLFRQTLQQRGISEALVRSDLGQGLVARQLLVPAAFGSVVPRELVSRYATLLREKRTGSIALIPAAAFASATPPSDAEIQAYYTRKRDGFIRPERRVVRYATFGEDALKSVPAPTDAEIATRYSASKTQYAAQETRRLTQLIVPTEAAARAIVAEVGRGATLEAAARSKGLVAAELGAVARDALSGQASPAVADAAFAADAGKIAAPARSGLGWHVIRVDGIDRRAARTLDQVRGEIVTALTEAKRRAAINDLSSRIEEQFDKGGNLVDAAKDLGVAIQSTEPITADGQVYGKRGQTAPPALGKVLQTAFSMEQENEPQLAEIEPGKTFVIFDVSAIAPSAPAPLAEIKTEVAADLMLEHGAEAARAAAQRVVAQTRKGSDLGAAMAALGKPLPPVDRITMNRQQLAASRQQVPPPLVLLFSMAEGTVKTLRAPNNRGWYVVALKDIEPGSLAANDPIFAQAGRELGQATGREYAESLRRAIRAEVGSTRNPAAIKAVRDQLNGGN